MSYRHALVTRWSRRDRLAVLVVATITALLVGSTLVVVTAGGETTRIAGQLETNGSVAMYDSASDARAAASPNGTVIPVARASVDGQSVTVVGLPEGLARLSGSKPRSAPDPGTIRGPPLRSDAPPNQSVALTGERGTVTVDRRERGRNGLVPPWWYVGTERTVERLGATGAFVLEPVPTGAMTVDDGIQVVPLTGALSFFLTGTDQLIDGLAVITVGAALLVLIVVISVTRMSVRDRLSTIAVLRATGLPRHRLVGLFAVRTGLLTTVAVIAGAAAGVVITNAAVNAAVFAGVPTTLSLQVTPRVARVLLPLLGGVVAAGVGAGVVAAAPTAWRSPAAIDRRARGSDRTISGDGWGSQVRPELLPDDAVLPTAATLSVFVAVALLVATLGTVVAPLQSPDSATIVQDGTNHPWVSRVDADYARTLRAEGIPASGEILLFSFVDENPFLTRGANFDAFAAVSDATLIDGRPPSAPNEAAIGQDLARTLGVSVGETVPLGGSDNAGFATVEVVGRYQAPGLGDDQLVVPLQTARHLSNVGPGNVNLVRLRNASAQRETRARDSGEKPGESIETDVDDSTTAGETVVFTALSAPRTVSSNASVTVTATVENRGTTAVSTTRTVTLGTATRTVDVNLAPGERTNVSVTFPTPPPGTVSARAGAQTVDLTVSSGPTLQLSALPERGPPNATLLVSVTDTDGRSVPNATIGLESVPNAREDASNSRAAVRLPTEGQATIVGAAPGYRNATRSVEINATARQNPVGRLTVTPTTVEIFSRPEAKLTLTNPWNRSITRRVSIGEETHTVSLSRGKQAQIATTLPREASGRHIVRATVSGHSLATATYLVQGDDRLVSALATGETQEVRGSGLGQATTHVLGNLRVLVGTLLGLTALTTVATTTAAFARVVHARRETIGIYRATGATPRQLLQRVLGDGLRIAVPAALLALVAGYLGVFVLARTGVLTAFGIALVPSPSPVVLVGIIVATVGLALLGAGVATVALIRVAPARLLETHRHPDRDRGDRHE